MAGGRVGGVQQEEFEALRAKVAGMGEGMKGGWGEVRDRRRLCVCFTRTDVDANGYEWCVERVRGYVIFVSYTYILYICIFYNIHVYIFVYIYMHHMFYFYLLLMQFLFFLLTLLLLLLLT